MYLRRYPLLISAGLWLIFFPVAHFSYAQIPISPTQRPISGGGNSSVGVAPKTPEKQIIKTITYITLSEARQWISSDGKPLLAKLIAFEEIITESTSATPQKPVLPTITPTIVKTGKVRLMVNNKPVEIALDRLSQPDQDYIEKLRVTLQKKATPTP